MFPARAMSFRAAQIRLPNLNRTGVVLRREYIAALRYFSPVSGIYTDLIF